MTILAGSRDAPKPAWRRSTAPGKAEAALSCGGLALATLNEERAIDTLGPEWSALFEACGKPHQVFQAFEWLARWRSLYRGRTVRPAIVTGRTEGRLVLVWPLVVERRLGLRILSGMGEPLSQYGDALLAEGLDDAMVDAAVDHVLAMPADVISFRRIRDDAAIAPALRRRLGPPAIRTAAPFVDLSGLGSTEDFDKRFGGKIRQGRRRRRRRLEEIGSLRFDHHPPSPAAADLVATALRFKRDWARRHGTISPSLADPRFERFLAEAAQAASGPSDLRVSALRAGEMVVGVEISVLCKGRLFGHVLAPHPGYASHGVGGILAEATMHNAIRHGYAGVDLLAPADDYKLDWTDEVVGVCDHVVPRTQAGQLYALWLRRGRPALKRLARQAGPALAAMTGRYRRLAGRD